jgi:hypothetical protein
MWKESQTIWFRKMIKVALTPLEQAIKGKTEIDRELLRVFQT